MIWFGNAALELAWQVIVPLICVGIVAGGMWLAIAIARRLFPRGDR